MFTPIQLLTSYNDSKRATTPAELRECHPTHRTAATAGRSHLCCPAASSVYILSPGNLKASLRPRSDLVHILFLVMSSDRRHQERHRTVACHPTHPSADRYVSSFNRSPVAASISNQSAENRPSNHDDDDDSFTDRPPSRKIRRSSHLRQRRPPS